MSSNTNDDVNKWAALKRLTDTDVDTTKKWAAVKRLAAERPDLPVAEAVHIAAAATGPWAVDATEIECPTCDAWIGWACNGNDYGYHAAGYHPARERAAARLAASKEINIPTSLRLTDR